MTFALAVEYARHGITANAILPGWIETDMTGNLMANEKFSEAAGKRIPMRRWGKPADFGGLAVYLMSDASAYHTGQLLQIDGGYFRFLTRRRRSIRRTRRLKHEPPTVDELPWQRARC